MDGPLLWAFLLLGAALTIVGIELVIPSAGILGFAAIGCTLASIVIAFSVSMAWGLGMILIVGILAPIVFVLVVKFWPHTPIGRQIMTRRPDSPPPDVLPNDEHHQKIMMLKGESGVALTDLLPNGVVKINGQRFDAICTGSAIDAGQPIQVTHVATGKIHVQLQTDPKDDAAEANTGQDGSTISLEQPIEDLGLESLEDPLA